MRFPFFSSVWAACAGPRAIDRGRLQCDVGKITLRPQTAGRSVVDWWRGRRSFIARLSRGLRHRRREPRSQSKLGCIILCEIALEPVPNAGDKAGGLDGGAGLNSERQHLSAVGLVEQRKIFHNLELACCMSTAANARSRSALSRSARMARNLETRPWLWEHHCLDTDERMPPGRAEAALQWLELRQNSPPLPA